ncbi:MAG: triose-phosphate isomerase [Saprospiraceae bacterium]|nr:triose-phosphate isomerase [Saprospiraceae bacterium]
MRKKIVAGNWKMNTDKLKGSLLTHTVMEETNPGNFEVIFFPPFPFLSDIALISCQKQGFSLGAQNISEFDNGAFTGEVSAEMIASIPCKYVLVGHSERRMYFNENADVLNKKLLKAYQHGLIPLFCCGEPISERENDNYLDFVSIQIKESLFDLTADQLKNTVIAYEPIWAIGTGKTANPSQAQEMHALIRNVLEEKFDQNLVESIPILYGGSVNSSNASELFSQPDVDGGLVGGASLKAEEFIKIIASMETVLRNK